VAQLQKRVCIELYTRGELGSERQTGAGVDLHHRLTRSWAKHNQGFDGPAPVTEVSVNLEIAVQRVGGNLRKNGLGAAYWTRVSWLERHMLSLRPTPVQCGLRTPKKSLD
jgi:hypothetical protein